MFFRRKRKRIEDNMISQSVAVERTPIPSRLRFDVLVRDNYTCQYCGAKGPQAGGTAVLHIDHREPVSAGGTNDPLNLVTACQDCNLGKGARQIDGKKGEKKPEQWELCRIDLQLTGDHRRQQFTIRADRYGAGKPYVISKPRVFNLEVALPPGGPGPMKWDAYRHLLPEKQRRKIEEQHQALINRLKNDKWEQVSAVEFRRRIK
jgi:5-methylcytosine-specific restriction endonuclease McrA